MSIEEIPLRLAFQAREGVLLVVMRRQRKHHLRLVFGTREGVEAAT